jgi:MarR family transcriptional regulator, 2-MHQ and catechol-resistance regulon repressor
MKTNHYRGTKTETRALNAYVKLMRASESVAARVHRSLAETGLTMSQFGVMEALYHLGPLSQAEIAKKILKSSGNITMVIGNLEKRALVKRERDTEDRRYYAIQLTPEGRSMMATLFPRHAGKIVETMEALTAEEQEKLGLLCRKLGLRGTG